MSKTAIENVLEAEQRPLSLSPIADATTPTANITHELSSLTMFKRRYACNIYSKDFLVCLIKELNFAGK